MTRFYPEKDDIMICFMLSQQTSDVYWWIWLFSYVLTVKSQVLTRVTNSKIGFLGVLIYEMCFKTRCGFILLYSLAHLKLCIYSPFCFAHLNLFFVFTLGILTEEEKTHHCILTQVSLMQMMLHLCFQQPLVCSFKVNGKCEKLDFRGML